MLFDLLGQVRWHQRRREPRAQAPTPRGRRDQARLPEATSPPLRTAPSRGHLQLPGIDSGQCAQIFVVGHYAAPDGGQRQGFIGSVDLIVGPAE